MLLNKGNRYIDEELQKRLKEEELVKRGQEIELESQNLPGIQEEDGDEFEDDLLNEEREATEEELVARATAARIIVSYVKLISLRQLSLPF